ncbi:RDD family protein [Nitrosomonas sp.]|uniref:RDD family protein n=1 Tax=Nitrosomonas sp. TaxID=42353 RepID=UPI00283BEADA|nr:RDD family protein [Nitrosomonas sp.]MDR4513301.1 RDD family protein [Nitrosomonas sp.]
MTLIFPGFWRRFVSLLYEFLILLAVIFIASFIFHLIFRDANSFYFIPLYQFYLLIIMGYYFIWFWTHGGQTLAMQTWKIRVVTVDGNTLDKRKAITRYLIAVIGIMLFGIGILWALIDRDHQFLHDRLAGTRVIRIEN